MSPSLWASVPSTSVLLTIYILFQSFIFKADLRVCATSWSVYVYGIKQKKTSTHNFIAAELSVSCNCKAFHNVGEQHNALLCLEIQDCCQLAILIQWNVDGCSTVHADVPPRYFGH